MLSKPWGMLSGGYISTTPCIMFARVIIKRCPCMSGLYQGAFTYECYINLSISDNTEFKFKYYVHKKTLVTIERPTTFEPQWEWVFLCLKLLRFFTVCVIGQRMVPSLYIRKSPSKLWMNHLKRSCQMFGRCMHTR